MSTFLALIVLLLLVLVLAGVLALVGGIRRGQRRANEVVPGVPSPAPPGWAGAHTPEARLHRRLRDAVRALRAQSAAGAPSADRHQLEQAALDIDARLVAVAALPERLRTDHLATAEAAVTALEDAAGAMLSDAIQQQSTGEGRLSEITQRLRLLEEARAELDQAVPPPGARPDLAPPPRPEAPEGDEGQPEPGT